MLSHGSLWRATALWHLNLDDVVLDCVHDQIADGVQAELPHDVAAVGFHGLGAQVQQYGHFLGTLPLSEKLGNFTLAGSQRRQIRRLVPGYSMSFLQEAR